MTEWLLTLILVSATGVVSTHPVGTFTSADICRHAREAEYQTGLYVPLKDGAGRLLYCVPRAR